LRHVDSSKCVCDRGSAGADNTGGAYSAPLDPLAGFRIGKRGRGMERARDGKGTEGERMEGEEKGEEGRMNGI